MRLQDSASSTDAQDGQVLWSRRGAKCSPGNSSYVLASIIGGLPGQFRPRGVPARRLLCYEASRATSGRVSPSDLPDSPSQTMPTSPRPGGSRAPPRPSKAPSVPPLAPAHQKSVYADVVTSYQMDGTPAVFSTCTSLSGLDRPA